MFRSNKPMSFRSRDIDEVQQKNDEPLNKDFIRMCVIEELDKIVSVKSSDKQKATKKERMPLEKQAREIICECGKDITKLKPAQIQMHERSKYHLDSMM